MTNLEQQIALWHESVFGKTVRLSATYRKLLEEIGELGEALMQQDPVAISDEVGDCALVLAHIIRGACPDQPSLQIAMAVALDKCEGRTYTEQGGKHDTRASKRRVDAMLDAIGDELCQTCGLPFADSDLCDGQSCTCKTNEGGQT